MLCLDVSPIIAQKIDKFSVDESSVIGFLDPLTEDNRNVLSHPLMNAYIIMKYNSYAAFFLAILVLKMCYAVSVSGLGLTAMKILNQPNCSNGNQSETCISVNDPSPLSEPSFWIWFILTGIMTSIMLVKEVAEMVNGGTKWISLHNITQLFLVFSIFVFQALLTLEDSSWYFWMKYLAAWTVFAVWMDITLALRTLVFGKWSSLGLYILMLKEVQPLVSYYY